MVKDGKAPGWSDLSLVPPTWESIAAAHAPLEHLHLHGPVSLSAFPPWSSMPVTQTSHAAFPPHFTKLWDTPIDRWMNREIWTNALENFTAYDHLPCEVVLSPKLELVFLEVEEDWKHIFYVFGTASPTLTFPMSISILCTQGVLNRCCWLTGRISAL